MGKEFKVLKELATVSATITELAAVNRILCAEIPSTEFRADYDSLISDIRNTYGSVWDTLQPLLALLDAETFPLQFDALHQWYGERHLVALSEPRFNAEFTYEKYLQFRKRKEVKTGYPPLKAAFSRLHDFIDKWIDNDIWLAMSIDVLLKHLNLVLDEVALLKKSDGEEALALYQSVLGGFGPFLAIIADALESLPALPPESREDAVMSAVV